MKPIAGRRLAAHCVALCASWVIGWSVGQGQDGPIGVSAQLRTPSDLTDQIAAILNGSVGGEPSALDGAPANDDFANRIIVPTDNGYFSGDNIGATAEPGEPAHAGMPNGHSVWWTWRAPIDTPVTITCTSPSGFDTVLAVYRGDRVDQLTAVESNGNASGGSLSGRLTFSAEAGQHYQIVVAGVAGAEGTFSIFFRTEIVAENDSFAGRRLIVAGPTVGNLAGATREPGEPERNMYGGGSVWFTWLAPRDCTVELAFSGYRHTGFSVYVGTAVDALTEVGTRLRRVPPAEPTTVFGAVAGTAYQIAVSAEAGSYYNYNFEFALVIHEGPLNDQFASRIEIPGTYFGVGSDTTWATREIGEPVHADGLLGATLWWKWTAVLDGTATFSGRAIYTGDDLSSLVRLSPTSDGYRVTAGTTYQVAYDVLSENSLGPCSVSVGFVPAPANNLFERRLVLSGESVSAEGSVRGAWSEPEQPAVDPPGRGQTVWWTWTAPTTTAVVASVAESNVCLSVYAGTSLANLAPVLNEAGGEQPIRTVRFQATAGASYVIAVDACAVGADQVTLSLVPVPTATNDAFAHRTAVEGSVWTVPVSNADATLEPGEPAHLGYSISGSVWWRWTAPESAVALLRLTPNVWDGILAVYTGASVDALTPVYTGFTNIYGEGTFDVVAGTEYQIAFAGIDLDVASGWMHLVLAQPSGNDDFANASVVVGGSTVVSGSNLAASREDGEPAHRGIGAASSVWWTWVAPENGTACISASTRGIAGRVGVYTGNILSDLSPVLNSWQQDAGSVVFAATQGTLYRIAVDAPEMLSGGDYSLSVNVHSAPANDDFVGRSALIGATVRTTGDNTHATAEVGESPFCSTIPISRPLWWSWTAPRDGWVVISTVGSTPDTVLGVSTGSSLGELTWIACNDDRSYGDASSEVRFQAAAGTTYNIVVDSKADSVGGIVLSVDQPAPPGDDMFANPTELEGASVTFEATTVGAIRENGEPLHGGQPGERFPATVWLRWSAPSDGVVRVAASGAPFDLLIAVYTGDALESLMPVFNSVPAGSSCVFRADAGQTYHIAVACEAGFGADFSLNLEMSNPPGNDLFEDRTVLTGTQVSFHASNDAATLEPGEVSDDFNIYFKSTWWSWVAPQDGQVLISFNPVGSLLRLRVFSGEALGNLTLVAQTDVPVRTVSFEARAGTVYQIEVNSIPTETADADIALVFGSAAGNDAFADAAVLEGAPVVVSGSALGATVEAGEPIHGMSGRSASVWWRWTAPSTGTATVSLVGQRTFAVGVYEGSTVADLTSVLDRNAGTISSVRFHACEGSVYYIAAASSQTIGGDYSLSVSLDAAPANDLFDQRAELFGNTAHAEVDSRNATLEKGEGTHGFSTSLGSVWWKWTAPADGTVMLTTPGTSFSHAVSVYNGTDVANLAVVARKVGSLEAPYDEAYLLFRAVAGSDYAIAISATSAQRGNVVLDLRVLERPANDTFEGRTPLQGEHVVVDSSLWGALSESTNPSYSAGSLWWSWTAPSDGRAIVDVAQSCFDARVTVGILTDEGLLAPADYVSGTPWFDAKRVLFEAEGGTQYHISVSGTLAPESDVHLDVQLVQAPVNDVFSKALWIFGGSASMTGSNVGAIRDAFENLPYPFDGASIWWNWLAPASGRVAVSTFGSQFDTALGVFTGTQNGGLTRVATNDDASVDEKQSWLEFDAVAGTVYRIVVDSAGWERGSVRLNLTQAAAPTVSLLTSSANASFGRGITLQGTASGDSIRYQWYHDGRPVPGGASATLEIAFAQPYHEGEYRLVVTNGADSVSTESITVTVEAPAVSAAARVQNLSARALCQTGDNVLIPGFVIGGTGTKRVLLRAVGPELGPMGVEDPLIDPQMTVRRLSDGATIATSEDWVDEANAADIAAAAASVWAFPLDADSTSAALLLDLPTGSYTAVSSGHGDETGVAIVEVYDISGTSTDARLVNISNRGFVGVGGNVMIPGFIVSEEGARTFLIRAVGPTLGGDPFNVPGTLADPVLRIFNGNGANILTNDNWGENGDAADVSATAQAVYAFPLNAASADAAFVVTLPPGAYTVQASGVGDTTGVALVEVYLVQE